MPIVTFNYADFTATLPEFAGVSEARATAMFNRAAALYLDNTDNSPVMDVAARTQLFYLLIGHLLMLFGLSDTPVAANGAPPGRISSATQGTISTSFELGSLGNSPSAAFFGQTQYGIDYWIATQRFRSVRIYANGESGIGVARAYGQPPFYIPGGI